MKSFLRSELEFWEKSREKFRKKSLEDVPEKSQEEQRMESRKIFSNSRKNSSTTSVIYPKRYSHENFWKNSAKNFTRDSESNTGKTSGKKSVRSSWKNSRRNRSEFRYPGRFSKDNPRKNCLSIGKIWTKSGKISGMNLRRKTKKNGVKNDGRNLVRNLGRHS